jgi:hypothetical protein
MREVSYKQSSWKSFENAALLQAAVCIVHRGHTSQSETVVKMLGIIALPDFHVMLSL